MSSAPTRNRVSSPGSWNNRAIAGASSQTAVITTATSARLIRIEAVTASSPSAVSLVTAFGIPSMVVRSSHTNKEMITP